MIKFLSLALIIIAGLSLMGCPGECTGPTYQFNTTVHMYPEMESLVRGDTLWIESVTSTTLRDKRSGQDIHFNNAVNFGSTIRVSELQSGLDTLIDAVNSFTRLAVDGQVYTDTKFAPARVLQFKYVQIGEQYRLRLGLVCQRKGIFALSISGASNVHQLGMTPCQGASIQVETDNIDNHLHYLQDLYFKSQPIEESEKRSSYCFVVQ